MNRNHTSYSVEVDDAFAFIVVPAGIVEIHLHRDIVRHYISLHRFNHVVGNVSKLDSAIAPTDSLKEEEQLRKK